MGANPAKSRALNPRLRLIALSLGLIVALGGIGLLLVFAAPDVEDNFARFWPLAFVGFPIMGALVLWRQPGNRVGLIMLWIGITAGIPSAITAAAVLMTDPTISAALEKIGNSIPIDWMLIVALLVVFPTGRTTSRPLRWLLRFLFVLTPFIIGLAIVADAPLPASGRENPLAVPGLQAWSEVALAAFVVVPVSACVALASMVRRWRRATGTARLQYRWFAASIAVLVAGVSATGFLPWFDPVVNVLAVIIGVNAVPIAVAVAVLRYRLFEIDRLVSRTVSYAVMIALLAVIYTGTIYLVQGVVQAESELAVAGSTLAAAAAFNPLRRRVQALVDRRFNRARFNAESEALAFAERLHKALDLSTVMTDLGAVLTNTVKPVSSTIWIRD